MGKNLKVFVKDGVVFQDKPKAKVDQAQKKARRKIEKYFKENKDAVVYSRVLEVRLEDDFFHWITNRAMNELVEEGELKKEPRKLSTGTPVNIVYKKENRYYKRSANRIMKLAEEYNRPEITSEIGERGELLVQDGFARFGFLQTGREANKYNGKEWTETAHNIDFIFERDGKTYGVEVKNELGYMDKDEIDTKIRLCKHLEIIPVFVVRMFPKSWIDEIRQKGYFSLIMKYQLYPRYLSDLAGRLKEEFGYPIGTPRRLEDGTIQRFMNWHNKSLVKSK